MPGIDSLLRIMVQQDAAEMHLAPDQPPRLIKGGAELALTMPPMPAATLQVLLADLWSDNEAALRQADQVTTSYSQPELGNFELLLRSKDAGATFAVKFTRKTPAAKPTKAPPAAAAPVSPPALAEALRPILTHPLALGASDVHLSHNAPPTARIDGELRALDLTADAAHLLNAHARAEIDAGRALDLGIDVDGVGRVRVHIYATSDGVAAAVRILAREAPRLADLHMPVDLGWLLKLPHGLVIVCGPTGSGKSSTLAALAREAMQQRARLLITLEDPIEYRLLPGPRGGLVRQRQVGAQVGDFATGLRDALREDPDILLIGEMRDQETISLALTAAETGHLVLASLHSRTAASAVERIVDTYAAERQRQIRVQLADSLRVVISQRLLPRATGAGRVPALEVLKINHAVANLIRDGKTAQIVSALQAGGEEGMLLLERNLADLVRARVISAEAAEEAANDVSTLNQYLTRK